MADPGLFRGRRVLPDLLDGPDSVDMCAPPTYGTARSTPMTRLLAPTLLAVLVAAPAVRADEGMWTFNNFPSARVKKKYGFSPDQEWLDHVRLSSRAARAAAARRASSPPTAW